jgi:hypothetical protein
MSARRPWLLVIVLVLFPHTVQADDHRADFYAAAFSFVPGSLLLGPHATINKTLELGAEQPAAKPGEKPRKNKMFSLVLADFSTHFGSEADEGKRVTVAFGGRISKALGGNYKVVHSGRALAGVAYGTDNPDDKTDPGFVFGYEMDYMPGRTSLEYEGWAFRAQVDYVVRKGDNENFVRLSTGFAYRWKTD